MSTRWKGMSSSELSKRLDAIIKEQNTNHRIDELTQGIIDTCNKMHKHLTKAVGVTQVATRSGRYLAVMLTLPGTPVYAAVSGTPSSIDEIRRAFEQLMDIATAIAEPILWFYALTSLILMATGKSKMLGWSRLKNVGYAYIGMTMLPTIFAFLRWVSTILKSAFHTFS